MYKESASHSEQAECVASLVLKTEEVRTRFGYSDQDARSLVLNNVRSIAYATKMVLNLLDSWCIGDAAVRAAIPQLLGLTNVNDRTVKVAGDTLHKTTKLSLIILGQFQIENCLRNLARELNIKMPNRGFYPIPRRRMVPAKLVSVSLRFCSGMIAPTASARLYRCWRLVIRSSSQSGSVAIPTSSGWALASHV